MKFRKKPVVVEAFQWFENHPSFEGMELDLNSPSRFSCNTAEGKLNISSGDWIIKGINGEFYPCKPDVFEKTYEPIDKSFKCAKCNNIIEYPSYQAPHLYCKECLTEEGWISRYSALPGIGKKVETDGIAGKNICSLSLNGEYIEWRNVFDCKIVNGIKCWRNLQHKEPEFSKLREGDFIVIESKNEKCCAFYSHQDEFTISFNSILYKIKLNSMENEIFKEFKWCCQKSYIKKITRINLETKEFEEI